MTIVGLDIATSTGVCVLKDGMLNTYKNIVIPQEMNLLQRLSFFEHNLNKVLDEYNPDYVALEDVICGISGVKTTVYLSRLSGVALSCCYKKVSSNIALFTPSDWKANSFENLNGTAKKYEIQIAVCKHFNLIDDPTLTSICKPLNNIKDNTSTIQKSIEILTQDTKKYIAFLNRKKNGCKNDYERKSFIKKIEENKSEIKMLKDTVEKNKKDIDNIYKNVSMDIMSRVGLNCDVSDSIGIAYCLWKKLNTH